MKLLAIIAVALILLVGILSCELSTQTPPTPEPDSEVETSNSSKILLQTPADFTITELSISPNEIEIGKTITASVNITNSGGSLGDYIAILNIDNDEVGTRSVTLNAGESKLISFTLTIGQASTGNHSVEIGGLVGTLNIRDTTTVIDTTPVTTIDCTCYSYTLKRYIPCEQATAICKDGTCSMSKSRSGTCSHHGGVARWIK